MNCRSEPGGTANSNARARSVPFDKMSDTMCMSPTEVAGKRKSLALRLRPGCTPTAVAGSENVRPAVVFAVSVSCCGPGMGGWNDTTRSSVSPGRMYPKPSLGLMVMPVARRLAKPKVCGSAEMFRMRSATAVFSFITHGPKSRLGGSNSRSVVVTCATAARGDAQEHITQTRRLAAMSHKPADL
eukprot:317728-Chlamydomonas_euryale.AAC.4